MGTLGKCGFTSNNMNTHEAKVPFLFDSLLIVSKMNISHFSMPMFK